MQDLFTWRPPHNTFCILKSNFSWIRSCGCRNSASVTKRWRIPWSRCSWNWREILLTGISLLTVVRIPKVVTYANVEGSDCSSSLRWFWLISISCLANRHLKWNCKWSCCAICKYILKVSLEICGSRPAQYRVSPRRAVTGFALIFITVRWAAKTFLTAFLSYSRSVLHFSAIPFSSLVPYLGLCSSCTEE